MTAPVKLQVGDTFRLNSFKDHLFEVVDVFESSKTYLAKKVSIRGKPVNISDEFRWSFYGWYVRFPNSHDAAIDWSDTSRTAGQVADEQFFSWDYTTT